MKLSLSSCSPSNYRVQYIEVIHAYQKVASRGKSKTGGHTTSMIVPSAAQREKKIVALSSVGAAIGLTSLKLAVALLTGSLGIMAEAAHSGLDLVAALMTFLAVRVADRPATRTARNVIRAATRSRPE